MRATACPWGLPGLPAVVRRFPAGAAFPALPDTAVTVAVSFVCAVQAQGFRKIHGSPIATTMCTGNLRAAIEAALAWRRGEDPGAPRRELHTLGATACFVLGAAVGAAAVARLSHGALWLPVGLLLAACLLLSRRPAGEGR